MKTYEGLCRFLSSYPDVTADERIKQIEITALEQYIATGERAEYARGVKIEAETGKEEAE